MAEKAYKVTGGCLCGAVRYEAEAYIKAAHYCHCRMCQKTSGAPADLVRALLDAEASAYPAIVDASRVAPLEVFALLCEGWEREGYLDVDRSKLFGNLARRADAHAAACRELVRKREPGVPAGLLAGERFSISPRPIDPDSVYPAGEGWTELHWRAALPSLPVSDELLAHQWSTANGTGITPLHFAAGAGDVDLVRRLLEAGADAAAIGGGGRTPLHEALDRPGPTGDRLVRVVGALLAAGADPEVRSENGDTPRTLAAERAEDVRDGHRPGPDPRPLLDG